MSDEEYNGAGPPAAKKDKRLSVERIYQKKSQLEHILLRPDTYIGSVQVRHLVMLSLMFLTNIL